jgi:hypothetical protein
MFKLPTAISGIAVGVSAGVVVGRLSWVGVLGMVVTGATGVVCSVVVQEAKTKAKPVMIIKARLIAFPFLES